MLWGDLKDQQRDNCLSSEAYDVFEKYFAKGVASSQWWKHWASFVDFIYG